MRGYFIVSILLLAVCGGIQASLRGSRSNIHTMLEGNSMFLEVSDKLRAGAPADVVLKLLQDMVNNMHEQYLADQREFLMLGQRCVKNAQRYGNVTKDAKHAVESTAHAIDQAHTDIEQAKSTIKEYTVKAKEAGDELSKLQETLHQETNVYNAAMAQYRTNQEQVVQAKHILEAILAHLAGSAPTDPVSTSLLQVHSHLEDLGYKSLARMTQTARAAVHAAVRQHKSVDEASDADLEHQHALSMRIVDMVLALKKRLERAHENEVRGMNESMNRFKDFAASIQKKIDVHKATREDALKKVEEADARVGVAQNSIAQLQTELAHHKADYARAREELKTAEDVCRTQAKEYHVRAESRKEDISLALAVYKLIKQKQNEIKAKLESLEHHVSENKLVDPTVAPSAATGAASDNEKKDDTTIVLPATPEDLEAEKQVNNLLSDLPVEPLSPLADYAQVQEPEQSVKPSETESPTAATGAAAGPTAATGGAAAADQTTPTGTTGSTGSTGSTGTTGGVGSASGASGSAF